MARRFITRHDVEAYLDRGICEIEVDDAVTVTDLAREHAQARGVRFVRVAGGAAAPPAGGVANPAPGDLRARVRASVVARLGTEPDNLDAIIDGILARAPDPATGSGPQ